MSVTPEQHPPHCVPAFHFGVASQCGFIIADAEAMRGTLIAILAALAESVRKSLAEAGPGLFAARPPQLRCVTSLAGEADRQVADAALAVGFTLQCPLPFPRDRCLADGTDASRRTLAALLARSEAVLELDFSPAHAADALLAAGRVVLDQSDLLLAIWDGVSAGDGPGPIVAAARAHGLPVIVVGPEPPHGVCLLRPADRGHPLPAPETEWRQGLADEVRRVLLPGQGAPGAAAADAPAAEARRYFAEPVPRVHGYGRLHAPLERLMLVGASPDPDPGDTAPAASPEPMPLDRQMHWADTLAIAYGSLQRTAMMLRYLLVLPTILGACIGFYVDLPGAKTIGFGMQAVSLAGILWLAHISARRAWLPRFIDYRLLAELLRHQRYFGALGLCLPRLRGLPHRPEAAASWVAWQQRAAVRESGLPADRLTPARLDALRLFIRDEVASQRRYHRRTGLRYAALARRLDRIGTVIYVAGLVSVVLRAGFALAVELRWIDGAAADTITLFNIVALVVPALAPVFLGLRSQAEFERLSSQYSAMATELAALLPAFDAHAPTYAQLTTAAEAAVRTMMRETADWRLVLKARPVSAT